MLQLISSLYIFYRRSYHGECNCIYLNKLPALPSGEELLSEKGVSYEERNVEQNDDFAQQVWDMGVRAIPVTVIGEHKIVGMNKTQFDKALATV